MKKNKVNPSNDRKKNNVKINWDKINKLTKMSYKFNLKKKIGLTLMLSFTILTIISSFIIAIVYSVQKSYNYNKYNAVSINIKLPKITKEDILSKYMYDSDESTIVGITEQIFSDQIPKILELNPLINFYIKLSNYNIDDLTLKIFDNFNYTKPVEPSDLIYYNNDPNKLYYIQFYYQGEPVKIQIHSLKLNITEQSFYIMLFSLFKNFQYPKQIEGNITNYFPKAYYAPYIQNIKSSLSDENDWLFQKVNEEVNLFLKNEKQETENVDNLENPNFEALQVEPYITTSEIPYINSYSIENLTKLQSWFKDSSNKYLFYKNSNEEPLNLNNNTNIYITLLPKSFDVNEFIINQNPLNYYENLKIKYDDTNEISDSILPIYQSNLNGSDDTDQLKYPYYNDWSNNNLTSDSDTAQSTFKQSSLTTFYDKNAPENNFNIETHTLDQIKSTMLENVYNYLCESLEKSYESTPITLSGSEILKEEYGINNENDLELHLKFIDIYHNINPDLNFSIDFKCITIDNLKNTRCILFQLPSENKNNNIKNSNDWIGGFLFKENNLDNIER